MEDPDRGAGKVVVRVAVEVIGGLIILQVDSRLHKALDIIMGVTILEEGLGHHMGEVGVGMTPAVRRMGLGVEGALGHCNYRHQQVHTFLHLPGHLRRSVEEVLVPCMTIGGQ